MNLLLRKKYGRPKYLICISLLLLLVYFEWLCYFVIQLQWPELSCGFVKNVHKILFVADPQILGEINESFIARTDCDRFLKSTYNHAVNYVKPDLIVFLGDLMDEGSIATSTQYERYFARFRDIYQLDKIPKNQTIFIPGDNDIGGEDEDVTEFKVDRFVEHFSPLSDVVSIKNMNFYKVNSMMMTFPDVNVENDTSLRIIISHMPLLGIDSKFGSKAISQLKPLFIFSAHDHKSAHLVTAYKKSVRDFVEELEYDQIALRFNTLNSGRVNEIVVPTSSYRMGTVHSGYGVALLGVEGDALCYFTLWSPNRLYHLLFYLLTGILIVLLIIFYYSIQWWHRLKQPYYSHLLA